ncbi:MAG: selenocysteine-specific translation elongation factor [Polyangiaceae bacterium]|nr:selenocysteine-specific translation elongation factor [Polyangiaceae bacterium]
MRHVVMGTAGHVDHGKTALVRALTGIETDRLPEEQRRGITIELGFAPWRLGEDLLVSLIDVPGHRRLVHTMIAGAAGIELVLLVVAADEGVMPQTREHVAACRLLGVRRAVVAVSKVDRVEPDLAELAAEEALELVRTAGLEAEAVPCSAKTGVGLDALRAAVLRAVAATAPSSGHKRVRLSVDRVFTVHGAGTVVTGTLVEGKLATGEPLRVLGAERELATSARALHVHGEPLAEVVAPTRLAVNLAGLPLEAVARGDVVTNDPHVRPTRVCDVWLECDPPPRRGTEATLFVGTAHTQARIQPVETPAELAGAAEGDAPAEAAPLGGGRLARLRLTGPLVVFGGDRFVLRGAHVDGPAGAVIGGGVVLDAVPPHERAGKRALLLAHLWRRDAAAAARALVAEQAPRALAQASLASRLCIGEAELGAAARAAAKAGELVALRAGSFVTATALAALEARALELCTAHHLEHPLDAGMKKETLRAALAAVAGDEATVEALGRLGSGSKPRLVVVEDVVRLPTFRGAVGDARAQAALERATGLVRDAGLQGLSENALTEALAGDVKQARALLALFVRDKLAIRAGELWFWAESVAALGRDIAAHLAHKGTLTIADFKAMTGLGRKQTIPLLEHFDRERLTKRVGTGDRIAGA